jgi:homoserine dehydrogenase
LRFRVEDAPGIIARLATILAGQKISIDSVLQLPIENWRDLPFVITVEPTSEESIRAAIKEMQNMNFLLEPPLAMPMEAGL